MEDVDSRYQEEIVIIEPKCKIQNIDSRGKLELYFNVEMNFPDNFNDEINNKKRHLTDANELLTIEI